MEKLNTVWGILNSNTPIADTDYGRKFKLFKYKNSNKAIFSVLVPYSAKDPLRRAHRIESLVQLVLNSILRADLLALDPVQTYTVSTLQYPEPGLTTTSEYDLNIKITGTIPVGRLRVHADVSDGDTITYKELSDNRVLQLADAAYPINYTGGQSADIPVIPNVLYIRLRDTYPDDFSFGMEYIAPLQMDWEELYKNITKLTYTFSVKKYKDIWDNEPNWVDKISAFVLDVVQDGYGK
jgi:hypothetical protein